MTQIAEDKLHTFVMPNGKHKGTRLVRVPVGYLLWMVNTDHSLKSWAEAELKRRGTTLPTVDVSGHAIDRASQKCLKRWHLTRDGDEGLYHWLCRMSAEALEKGAKDEQGRVHWSGMRFSFEDGVDWPVLKTVTRA